MERIKEAGLARSIGVSNFDKKQLKEVLAHAKHVPAVNQVSPPALEATCVSSCWRLDRVPSVRVQQAPRDASHLRKTRHCH
jgi:predicted oxidoreductase